MSFRLSSHTADKWMIQEDLWHTDRNTRIVRLDQISGPSHPASCLRAKLMRVEKHHKERDSRDTHATNNTGGTMVWELLFFHQKEERGAELLNLKPLVSTPKLMAGSSLHSDWDPGRRMPLVLTFPVVSKHCYQTLNANFCLLKDSSSSPYSCLGLWIFFMRGNNKSCIFTMYRISTSLLHDNEGMPQCLRPEIYPQQCWGYLARSFL